MRQRRDIYQVFAVLVLLSLSILILSPTRPVGIIRGIIERISVPLIKSVYINLGLLSSTENKDYAKLKNENINLIARLVNVKKLEKDNQALRDQFIQTEIPSLKLLPVDVIGINTLFTTNPVQITIDKGRAQGLKAGLVVVYKNIFIGTIDSISEQLATVSLTTSDKTSMTVKTLDTEVVGVLKGTGDGLVLTSVLLSDKLKLGDIIVTNEYPLDLVIGKISAIDKKPSALFQSAAVDPLIDITKLSTVFVLIGK
jgi:rod shape-determining protein MreC